MLVVAGASPAPSMSALVGAVEVPSQACLCIMCMMCITCMSHVKGVTGSFVPFLDKLFVYISLHFTNLMLQSLLCGYTL